MPNYFRLALDKAREFWFKLNRTQRVFVGGAHRARARGVRRVRVLGSAVPTFAYFTPS